MMNLQAIKDWIKILEHANSLEQNSPLINLMDTRSDCGSPGCLVGWSYQLMPELREGDDPNNDYDFCDSREDLAEMLGINDYDGGFYSDEFDDAWRACFPGASNHVFSGACAYIGIDGYAQRRHGLNPNAVSLSLIIDRWKQFVQFLESRTSTQVS